MTARLAALLPRLFALTLIGLLAATSITFASATRKMEEKESEAAPVQAGPRTLRIPDVRGQAYVFAKGILEDAGFSWQVVGPVEGYAANIVSVQSPAPGVEVLDNGSPTIELRLERNPDYSERGLPEDTSSYEGSELRLADDPLPAAETTPAEPAEPAEEEEAPKEEPEPKPEEEPAASEPRKPDFVVPGAPAEPADEMPLPDRARLVEQRLAAPSKPAPALVNWWLYQHSWIVTGAKFGWHDGADALRILIRVDRSIEERFGFGAKSLAVAERALAEVQARAED
jgi:PASTA domain